MVAFLHHVPAHGKEPISQRRQFPLNMDPQNSLAEEAHQIVRQHDHIQRRLGTVKTVQVETVKTEIVFEFLDPILRLRTLLIKILRGLTAKAYIRALIVQ